MAAQRAALLTCEEGSTGHDVIRGSLSRSLTFQACGRIFADSRDDHRDQQ